VLQWAQHSHCRFFSFDPLVVRIRYGWRNELHGITLTWLGCYKSPSASLPPFATRSTVVAAIVRGVRFGANLAICILPRLLQPLATPSAFNKHRSKRANGALSNIRPGPSCEGKENADTGDRRKGDGTRIATNAADIRKGMVNFVFLKKCLELLQMFISSWMQSA